MTYSNIPSTSFSILKARSCIATFAFHCCRYASDPTASLLLAGTPTTTRSTVLPRRFVHMLGCSLIIVKGEKCRTVETMLAFTDVGGVPFAICSSINSQTKCGQELAPPPRPLPLILPKITVAACYNTTCNSFTSLFFSSTCCLRSKCCCCSCFKLASSSFTLSSSALFISATSSECLEDLLACATARLTSSSADTVRDLSSSTVLDRVVVLLL